MPLLDATVWIGTVVFELVAVDALPVIAGAVDAAGDWEASAGKTCARDGIELEARVAAAAWVVEAPRTP